MNPIHAESDVAAAIQNLGSGPFPDLWKSTFVRAAAVVCRLCPPTSPYAEQAKSILAEVRTTGAMGSLGPGWDSPKGDMAAVLNALLSDIKSGALWRGLWDAKNDTCNDILQQADDLFASHYLAAAAVLSGGALEAHLKDLCQRHNLPWVGDGSISKYQNALSAAQNKGQITFFSSGDGKLVTAWGDLRNRAAHDPSGVAHVDATAISLMLQGVRDFIHRVP